MADGGAVASCNVDSEEGAVVGSGAPVLEDTYTGCFFLTVPPEYQYQNEKQVAANQDYFFKKFLM